MLPSTPRTYEDLEQENAILLRAVYQLMAEKVEMNEEEFANRVEAKESLDDLIEELKLMNSESTTTAKVRAMNFDTTSSGVA